MTSLVPGPRPAFHCLQYGKSRAGRAWEQGQFMTTRLKYHNQSVTVKPEPVSCELLTGNVDNVNRVEQIPLTELTCMIKPAVVGGKQQYGKHLAQVNINVTVNISESIIVTYDEAHVCHVRNYYTCSHCQLSTGAGVIIMNGNLGYQS